MKAKSLVNAIKKTGLKLDSNDNRQFYVEGPQYTLSYYIQNDYVICLHACRNGLESDPYSDYNPGFFPSTIKYAIETLTRGEL